MNTERIVDVAFVLLGVVAFFIFGQLFGAMWDFFQFSLMSESFVSVPYVAAIVGAIILVVGLRKNNQVAVFTHEAVVELAKVTWPMKKETLISSVVVVIMLGIAAVIMALFDGIWGAVTQRFLT